MWVPAFLVPAFVFGGLAYGLRRFFGRRHWLWGIPYFLVAYLVGFWLALFTYAGLDIMTAMEASRAASTPALVGAVVGTSNLCARASVVPGVTEYESE